MNNKEIELKFIINKEIKDSIISDLQKIAKAIGTSRLIDTYYTPNFKSFELNGETVECVRIRENHKGSILCYKKIHLESTPVYCDEFETLISDKKQMENILFALGFSIEMTIDKTRESYQYKNFRFDFDSIKNLGEFMEVELDDHNANIEDIYSFVKKYGLTEKDINHDGIQNLMKKSTNK